MSMSELLAAVLRGKSCSVPMTEDVEEVMDLLIEAGLHKKRCCDCLGRIEGSKTDGGKRMVCADCGADHAPTQGMMTESLDKVPEGALFVTPGNPSTRWKRGDERCPKCLGAVRVAYKDDVRHKCRCDDCDWRDPPSDKRRRLSRHPFLGIPMSDTLGMGECPDGMLWAAQEKFAWPSAPEGCLGVGTGKEVPPGFEVGDFVACGNARGCVANREWANDKWYYDIWFENQPMCLRTSDDEDLVLVVPDGCLYVSLGEEA